MAESNATTADVGVAILMCALSVLGITFNGLGLLIVRYNPILANVFGKLCFSHCIANLGVCSVFLLWTVPLTIIQDNALATSIFGKILGQVNTYFWELCVYCHLAISINRFFCIAFPMKAVLIVTPCRERIIIALPWLLAFCHIIPYFWYSDCYFVYTPNSWSWKYAPTECGRIVPTYLDEYTGFLTFIIIAVLDMVTLFFLRKNHQVVSDMVFDYRKVPDDAQIARRRRKTEMKFFLQSCVQGVIFFFELTSFYILYKLNTDKYYVFFTTTFVWVLCHLLDGFVLVCFHVKSYQRQRTASLASLKRFHP